MRVEAADAHAPARARPAYNYAVGYLRGTVILLVIISHAVLGYYPGPFPFTEHVKRMGYPVLDPHHFAGARTYMAFADGCLMAMMFFVSGFFVLGSLRRKGPGAYLRDRGLRLGLPFLFSAYGVGAIAYYAAYLQAHPSGGSLAEYFFNWQNPLRWMSGAAWFIGVLLVYDVGVAATQRLAPGAFDWLSRLCAISDRPLRFYALIVGLTTVAYLPLVAIYGAYHWINVGPLWIYGSRLVVYPIYFALGIGMGGAGLEKSMVAPGSALGKRWLGWVIAAVVIFLAAGNLQLYTLKHHTTGDPAWRMIVGLSWPINCATLSFMMMALFVRFARPNRFFDSLSTNAYGMYLTHYAMVQWTVYALLTSPMRPELKAVVVFLVGATGSWLLTLALRRIPAVARII